MPLGMNKYVNACMMLCIPSGAYLQWLHCHHYREYLMIFFSLTLPTMLCVGLNYSFFCNELFLLGMCLKHKLTTSILNSASPPNCKDPIPTVAQLFLVDV